MCWHTAAMTLVVFDQIPSLVSKKVTLHSSFFLVRYINTGTIMTADVGMQDGNIQS